MIWNKELRTRLFEALSSIVELRYISIDFGQTDGYLTEEVPRPPFRCPAILVSDIREEVESSYLDKDTQPHHFSFSLRLLIDDARFATSSAPQAHLQAYDDALQLTESIIAKVSALDERMALSARTEAQLRDSLRQYTLSFSLLRRFPSL